MQIDLAKHKTAGIPILSGRDKGQRVRSYYKLDEIDLKSINNITISIPDDIITITSSFFLGMLGESVKALGSKEDFRRKFLFTGKNIDSIIDRLIETALKEQGWINPT